MRWTVPSLVRVVLVGTFGACLQACVKPHDDYDEFKSRAFAEPVQEAGAAPDVQLTACETLLQQDLTETYFAKCRPTVTGEAFGLLIDQTVTASDAGGGELTIAFTLLNFNAAKTTDTVGKTTKLAPTPISGDNCTYDL